MLRLIGCTLALLVPIALAGDAGGDALGIFRTGDYAAAIPLLKAEAAKTPADPAIAAALLSALVYEGRVDEASDAAKADATAFPNSPEVMAARGEFAYYMSDMAEAERLFRAAIKLKEATPRAYYGMYRMFRLACLYRSARLMCMRAHEIDPDDALITYSFLHYLAPKQREEMAGPFRAAHPWFYQHYDRDQETSAEVKNQLNGREAFELEGARQEVTLPLIYLRRDATRVRGVGLELSIDGARPLRLLFDTGASGILINQKAVDKAGLNHLGSSEVRGIGDQGARRAFVAVAETCKIASLTFKNCLFGAVEGKKSVSEDIDGLIGADFFSDYLIHIDFQSKRLHLTPLPERPRNPQGYDREIGPEEKSFTPVFRSGGHLFVQTKVNNKTWGLFLLDTGAEFSNLDATFARLSTKIYGDDFFRVEGVSGSVKKVYAADRAELQFAHFHQSNLGITVLDMNHMTEEHQDFRMAGILGIPVLSMFRLTIDYRNGLVDFDYAFK